MTNLLDKQLTMFDCYRKKPDMTSIWLFSVLMVYERGFINNAL